MHRRLGLLALITLLSLCWGTASQAEVEEVGKLRVTFNAGFAPISLPRERAAPVKVEIHGSIVTTDGSHPPALRWLEIDLHRSGRISTKGLPVCTAPILQSTSTREALARCGPARVGRGSFRADIALGEGVTATGTMLAFNSRKEGKPALLLHLFAAVPVRFTMVVPLAIGHRKQGQFGTVMRARIPKLGGGLGSITEIDLTIDRRYSFAGKRRSYLSAACGAPEGFTSGIFSFARGSFRFEGHRAARITLIRECKVR
jgi:hypothetical protein